MSATTFWDHQFSRNFILIWAITLWLFIFMFHSRPLLPWLWSVTLSSYFIPAQWCHITVAMIYFFCLLCLFLPYVWVGLLIGITDYFKSTLRINHIIPIYNYVLCDLYQIDCVASHSLEILFQNLCAVSPSPWFIVVSLPFVFPFRMSVTTCWYHWLQ